MSITDYEISDDGMLYFPDGGDDYITEPAYRLAKDGSGTTHVEVQDGWSEHVIWQVMGKQMLKTYDAHETVF